METVTIPKAEYKRLKKLEEIDFSLIQQFASSLEDLKNGRFKKLFFYLLSAIFHITSKYAWKLLATSSLSIRKPIGSFVRKKINDLFL
jgi:predicted AlkP superfamily phosphohydrolase/phosphomutase